MGLFDNYQNIKPNNPSQPNNITPRPQPPKPNCSKVEPCTPPQPFAEYNVEGTQVGYWWYYGNSVNLVFDIEGEVVQELKEETPATEIENEITPMNTGLIVPADEFLLGKKATIKLYNFRREPLDSIISGQCTAIYDIEKENPHIEIDSDKHMVSIEFPIDIELSKKLVRGNYYISLEVSDTLDFDRTLFYQNDCVLTVK